MLRFGLCWYHLHRLPHMLRSRGSPLYWWMTPKQSFILTYLLRNLLQGLFLCLLEARASSRVLWGITECFLFHPDFIAPCQPTDPCDKHIHKPPTLHMIPTSHSTSCLHSPFYKTSKKWVIMINEHSFPWCGKKVWLLTLYAWPIPPLSAMFSPSVLIPLSCLKKDSLLGFLETAPTFHLGLHVSSFSGGCWWHTCCPPARSHVKLPYWCTMHWDWSLKLFADCWVHQSTRSPSLLKFLPVIYSFGKKEICYNKNKNKIVS